MRTEPALSRPVRTPVRGTGASIEAFLHRYEAQSLLRFVAVGSVDDGKSTLIGRLLHDTGSVYRDQVEAVRRASAPGGNGPLDFALFTDGLKAEREQGITIDVAHRYFFTDRRKFIVADTPGHVQYTRNMVTGASTANVAVILIDARHGVVEQSRRHAAIASLLRVPHLVVCINKMDLVGFDPDVFGAIETAFAEFARGLSFLDVTYIPVSATGGDNVLERSANTPWYDGPTLLAYLEAVPVLDHRNHRDLRLPVQTVVRPNLDYRGLAGTIASGVLRPGDEVLVLPSGLRAKVAAIDTFDGPLAQARTPQSVVVRLADDLDAGRGDMLVGPEHPPVAARTFDAHLVWMGDAPLDPTRAYLLKHTTQTVRAQVVEVHGKMDLFSLGCVATDGVQANDIVRVRVRTHRPIFCDPYAENRATGAFILIDPVHHHTVAAGMVERALPAGDRAPAPAGPGALVLVEGPGGAIETAARRLHEAGCFVTTLQPAPDEPPGAAHQIARVAMDLGGVVVAPARAFAGTSFDPARTFEVRAGAPGDPGLRAAVRGVVDRIRGSASKTP